MNDREGMRKQNQFLNQWMIDYLKKKCRKCLHEIVMQRLESRFFIYGICATCGRTIKLRKEEK